jgi:hypothetical protein
MPCWWIGEGRRRWGLNGIGKWFGGGNVAEEKRKMGLFRTKQVFDS